MYMYNVHCQQNLVTVSKQFVFKDKDELISYILPSTTDNSILGERHDTIPQCRTPRCSYSRDIEPC